ncbi:unnamed protein product [Discula destructiva]
MVSPLSLNMTAIGSQNGASTLECWQMDSPFSISDTPGINGSAVVDLGDVANISYIVTPPGLDGGYHNPPHPQWTIFISGLAFISLPTNDVSAYISGEFGLIFAADTVGLSKLGHRTQYPGITETVSVSIPTKDGLIPSHMLLHYGPCAKKDIVGYDELARLESGIVISGPLDTNIL